MKITKFGHCCLLVEEKGLTILIDPGEYSIQQCGVKGIDIVLITHEHRDHCDIGSIMEIMKNNPKAKILTNNGAGAVLEEHEIDFELVENGRKFIEKGVEIEGVGSKHAKMHTSIPQIRNTGYFIANRFFYPGDALTDPKRPIEILALPVAAPWLKLSEGIDYALKLKPKVCFPVHDGILVRIGSTNQIPPKVLEPKGIRFFVPEIDKAYKL